MIPSIRKHLVSLFLLSFSTLVFSQSNDFTADHLDYSNELQIAELDWSKDDKGTFGNSQYYEFNAKGLRNYLESIRTNSPDLYNALNSDLMTLENREKKSKLIGYSLQGAGMVLFASGFMMARNSEPGASSTDSANTLTMVGFSLATAGFGAHYFLRPKESDYYEIINKHNRLNEEEPLEIRAGIIPTRNSAAVQLSLNF